MIHRYYIGLGLPDKLSNQIATIQADLFDPAVAIQPLVPHITLLPPPAVQDVAPDDLAPRAKQAAQALLPINFSLNEVVFISSRTLAIRVESSELQTLQYKLASLLPADTAAAGVVRRAYNPHVTLNQARRGEKELPHELLLQYRQALKPLLPASCQANHLTLYRWMRPRIYSAEVLY